MHQPNFQQNLRVPFGLKAARMVSPDEVSSGRACDCVCPSCYCPLVAKKGDHNVWHFAHDGAACVSGAETAIHLMAKQILVDEGNVLLPDVEVIMSAVDAFGRTRVVKANLAKAQHARYSRVELEVTKNNRRADAVGIFAKDSTEHWIEIFVRHAVDQAKRDELEYAGYACYEICLNDVSLKASTDMLRAAVVATPSRIRWISYPGMAAARERLSANLRKMLAAAEAQKKAEEAQAKLAYAAQVRESRAEQTAFGRRAREQKRGADRVALANTVFRNAGETEKRLYLQKKLRIADGAELPALIAHPVRGDQSFGVSRDIWQADVYRKVVFGNGAQEFGLEGLLAWMRLRYEVSTPFPNSAQVALWEYLAYLEQRGFVRHLGRQNFKVVRDVAPWLESAVAVSGSWFWAPDAGSCTLKDLQDANDEGGYKLSSETLLTLLRRFHAANASEGEPDDVARSLAQKLPVAATDILHLLSAARVVSMPQASAPPRSRRRDEPFEWPAPSQLSSGRN